MILSLSAAPAPAQNRQFLAGGETSGRDFYSYLGTVMPLPGSGATGWAQRYWLDYLGYQYQGGPGEVDARAWGAEALLGYRAAGGSGTWGAMYVGGRYAYTDLSPSDPAAEVRGGAFGLKAQVEGETAVGSRLRLNGIASYTFSTSGYWTRGRLLYGLPGRLHVGPEVILAGNPDYDARRFGMVLGGFRVLGGAIDVKAGYSDGSNGSSAYGGVEFFLPY